jgi:septal ring factor EnvC (AmiA/AmiB activator)
VALATLSKEKQRLLEIGLSPEALAEFSQRAQSIAQHRRITPVELRERLLQELENLGQAISLETLIQSRQAELEEQERAIATAKEESQSLKTVVGSLKKEKTSLEASIKETREKVGTEMAKMTAAASDMVNALAQELRHGHDEALAEVRRLKDEAVEVGKEVGRYEGMLQANQWLSELLALVRGEESIEGKRVRAIALSLLRGTAVWLKHNKANNLGFSTLSFTLENLIREMEQWKV